MDDARLSSERDSPMTPDARSIASVLADLAGLATSFGELRGVLLERGLSLGLGLVGALDAACDRIAASVECLVDLRHEAEEHETEDDHERDRSPDQVGELGNEH